MVPQPLRGLVNPARSGPSRRPPPLLVLAAAGLLAVIGIGVVLILTRGEPAPEIAQPAAPATLPDDDGRLVKPAEPLPVAAAPAASAPSLPAPAPAPVPAPAKSIREIIAETGEIPEGTRPEDLPIWARPPRVLAQPFPEGGRINPPLPPVKIPPEMLVPAPPPGAAP